MWSIFPLSRSHLPGWDTRATVADTLAGHRRHCGRWTCDLAHRGRAGVRTTSATETWAGRVYYAQRVNFNQVVHRILWQGIERVSQGRGAANQEVSLHVLTGLWKEAESEGHLAFQQKGQVSTVAWIERCPNWWTRSFRSIQFCSFGMKRWTKSPDGIHGQRSAMSGGLHSWHKQGSPQGSPLDNTNAVLPANLNVKQAQQELNGNTEAVKKNVSAGKILKTWVSSQEHMSCVPVQGLCAWKCIIWGHWRHCAAGSPVPIHRSRSCTGF